MGRASFRRKTSLFVVLLFLALPERHVCHIFQQDSLDESSGKGNAASLANTWIRRLPIPIEENMYDSLGIRVLDDQASFGVWMEEVQSSIEEEFEMTKDIIMISELQAEGKEKMYSSALDEKNRKQELFRALKTENIDFDAFNLVVNPFSEGSPRSISASMEPRVNHWNHTATVRIDRGVDNGGGCSHVYYALFYVVNKAIKKIYFDSYEDSVYECISRLVVSTAKPRQRPPLRLLLHEHRTETALWSHSREFYTELLFRQLPSPVLDNGYQDFQTAVLSDRNSFDQWKKDVIRSRPGHPPLQLWEMLDILEAERALDFEASNMIVYAFPELEGHSKIEQTDPNELDKSDRSAHVTFRQVESEDPQQEMRYFAVLFQVHKSVEKVYIHNEQFQLEKTDAEQVEALVTNTYSIHNRPNGTPAFEGTTKEEI